MRTLVRAAPLLLSVLALACELPNLDGSGGSAAASSGSGDAATASSSSSSGGVGASSSTGGELPALTPPEGCSECWDACATWVDQCNDDPVCNACVQDPGASAALCSELETIQKLRKCLLQKNPLDCTAKGCVPGPYHTCNPVTGEACDEALGGACLPDADWISDPQFECDYVASPGGPLGASCDPCDSFDVFFSTGCQPGNACFLEQCFAFCCDDADCGAEGRCSWTSYYAIGFCVTLDSVDLEDAVDVAPIPACNVPAAQDRPSHGACFP